MIISLIHAQRHLAEADSHCLSSGRRFLRLFLTSGKGEKGLKSPPYFVCFFKLMLIFKAHFKAFE